MHTDLEFASEALRMGAFAYVVKHSASESLSRAIRRVLAGKLFVSPRLALDVRSAVSGSPRAPKPLPLVSPNESAKCSSWWPRGEPSTGSPRS
jgi:DNA-binding NarL/FixJ family response regulator